MLVLSLALLIAFPQTDSSSTSQSDQSQSDVVVTGERPITPDEVQGISTPDPKGQAVANRERFSKSKVFAHCIRNISPEVMRKVIDGPPNRSDTRFAQGLLVSKHITCYLNTQPPPGPAAPFETITAGESPFDRGALLEQVFDQYAPHPKLTAAQTGNPAVQQRFDAREVPRNRWRLPVDYRTFAIAVCLVRMQPAMVTALRKTKAGSPQEKALEEGIIGRGRACVGGAQRVTFDAVAFRLYLLDALYRWIVAARGVDTLIGDKPMNPR